jgi:hypothetical protein
MMRRKMTSLAIVLLMVCGCGESVERMEPVPLDKLPPGSMESAAKAVPGVKFDRARKIKLNGQDVFEIIGKDKRGKVREVEVSTSGKVLAIE